jgi:hypothetical protein
MSGYEPSYHREDVSEVPQIDGADRGRPRLAKLEDRQLPAWTQHPFDLGQCLRWRRDVTDTKTDRHAIDRLVVKRDLFSIPPYHADHSGGSTTSRLLVSTPEHLRRKIDRQNPPRTTLRLGQRKRQISCPGTQVKYRFSSPQIERIDCSSTPRPILTGAQDAVEQVVSTGDVIEHSSDLAGRSVERKVCHIHHSAAQPVHTG